MAERVRELRATLEGLEVKEGELVIVEPLNFGKVRELAEMELSGSGIILLLPRFSQKKGMRKEKSSEKRARSRIRPRKEMGVVTIKSDALSYADLVRKVRGREVDVSDLGVNVSIRKNKTGDLMITVEGHRKAEKMGRAIEAQRGGLKVTVRKEEGAQAWVYGLDLATSDEEIAQAIGRNAGIKAESVKVLYKNETESGEAFALIEVPKAKIEGICRSRSIRSPSKKK